MPSLVSINNSFGSGELSPSVYGRTDLQKWEQGTFTCRNYFVDYRGGVKSRAGFAYIGTCKQPGTSEPPRDIPFQFNINQGYVLEFGDQYLRIKKNGAYVTETPVNVTSISPIGLFTTNSSHGYSVGDWVFDQGNSGFNGLTWIIKTVPSPTTFTVSDLFGNNISTAIASTGGTVSRIYTVVAPYAAIDLPYLKYTQSADVMSLTCVNTDTLTEYPPYSLTRSGNTNWVFSVDTFSVNIASPTNVTATAQSSTTVNTWYAYVVTAVDATTGEESIASAVAYIQNNDISLYQGSNTINWDTVAGAGSYNIYASIPSYSTQIPVGVTFGYLGSALGTQFVDTNIIPDFTLTPPIAQNPFSRGQILNVMITAAGSGYTQATVGYSITSATGSNFVGVPVVSNGSITGFIINNQGQNYKNGDTITFTDSGSGSGATGSLSIGPQSGTYPSVVAYYQQRRVYASTLNNPDTYYFSQPGLFNNMDTSIPVSASDSIIGTPWAQEVNGIQFLVPMPGGLVILTGLGAWQLNGGASAILTPADQVATPQAYNGCHNHVPPIVVNYDILYVQSKGSIVRDLSYNFFVNIYTGADLTVLSNHLFNFHQIEQWCWAEEPFKLVWAIRDDGVLLSLTYLKEQEVFAWSRHDTNGLFQSICTITEPTSAGATTALPALTNAVYAIVKRYIPKYNQWVYYSERMDNRIWNNVEDAFCVDAGLSYPVTFPNSTLQPTAAEGNNVIFTTNSNVFSANNVGDIIRVGGGKAVITQYQNQQRVLANITQSITGTIPNDPNNYPLPAAPGYWSISTPTSSVSGLNHLEGMLVSILADGSVVSQQTVTNGSISLPYPASQIVVGLPFVAQLQTTFIGEKTQSQTIQNKRKTISAVGVRVEQTRGLQIGSDQPDANAQQDYATLPWTNMNEIKERNNSVLAGSAIPLYTGDHYKAITAGWDYKGQVAIQQVYPLPANILAIITYWTVGDDR